jgi:hypothetical protein
VTTFAPAFDRVSAAFDELRRRASAEWQALPPGWRSEAALAAAGAVLALLLLVAFHQVVQASVERAAERDAAAYRQQALAALCSVEPDARAREVCLLTRPGTRAVTTQVAAAN